MKHLEKEFDSICGQKLSIGLNVKTSESIESEELNEKSGNKWSFWSDFEKKWSKTEATKRSNVSHYI